MDGSVALPSTLGVTLCSFSYSNCGLKTFMENSRNKQPVTSKLHAVLSGVMTLHTDLLHPAWDVNQCPVQRSYTAHTCNLLHSVTTVTESNNLCFTLKYPQSTRLVMLGIPNP